MAAEALHKSIVKPLKSPGSDHYRSTRTALLKAVREAMGGEVGVHLSGTPPDRGSPTAGVVQSKEADALAGRLPE